MWWKLNLKVAKLSRESLQPPESPASTTSWHHLLQPTISWVYVWKTNIKNQYQKSKTNILWSNHHLLDVCTKNQYCWDRWKSEVTDSLSKLNSQLTHKPSSKWENLNGKQMQMQNRLLLKVCVSSRTYQWQCHEHDNAYMGGLKYPITTKVPPYRIVSWLRVLKPWG